MSTALQFVLNKDQTKWQAEQAKSQARIARLQETEALLQLQRTKLEAATQQYAMHTAAAQYTLTKLNLAKTASETCLIDLTREEKQFGIDNLLPLNKEILTHQREAERAKTQDTLTEGGSVAGSVGKQQELIDRQILSFKNSDEFKMVKLKTDAWIAQKTLDAGILPPNALTNASLESVLNTVSTNLNL